MSESLPCMSKGHHRNTSHMCKWGHSQNDSESVLQVGEYVCANVVMLPVTAVSWWLSLAAVVLLTLPWIGIDIH